MMPRALNAYYKECMVLSDQTLCDAFYEVAKVAKASFENMQIERVIFNAPATVVYWKDGTKTVVKCQDGDKYSKETGLAMAIVKKVYGNSGAYNDIMKTWIKD
nr:MAG TPA: hypothetical protein [Caudoviricetes sp.]